MKSPGAEAADKTQSAARNKREAYKAAYRRYTAEGYTEQEAAAKAKAEAYGNYPNPYAR